MWIQVGRPMLAFHKDNRITILHYGIVYFLTFLDANIRYKFRNNFQWVVRKGIALSAGRHVLRIRSNQQYFNVNSLRVLASTS